MQLAHYLRLLDRAERELARAYREVADRHRAEVDVVHLATTLADECDEHARRLAPFADRYGEAAADPQLERPHVERFGGPRTGSLALLRDLHDLYLMADECELCWTLVVQAAQGARDDELLATASACGADAAIHARWLRTRMRSTAPQALIVAA